MFVAASTLVRAKPFHLLTQIARLLESPTGAFIAAQPQGRSKHIFTKRVVMDSCICPSRMAGSFSEDRPLGWDPVAEGNRAGDGMACNSNDRRQWRKQEVAVGTAASRMRVLLKARSIRWVPQPVLVSEEKAARCPASTIIERIYNL